MAAHGTTLHIWRKNSRSFIWACVAYDTVINTMAFSGYPDGAKTLGEMLRVLKPNGVLLLLDYDFPSNRNFARIALVRLIEASGDIIKNIGALIDDTGATYERKIIGGFGSVYDYFPCQKSKRMHVEFRY